ncbi:hypothetical protein [Pseudomonas sp. CC120222-01a]|uniref:hypothetical protein n=1 Tax=Pseudomonas sp. CC120222-01a TaxID=1378075 RepID=UPI0013053647|nr:hypothetical protein [Pseudomonas sp. CC120222-01a]
MTFSPCCRLIGDRGLTEKLEKSKQQAQLRLATSPATKPAVNFRAQGMMAFMPALII